MRKINIEVSIRLWELEVKWSFPIRFKNIGDLKSKLTMAGVKELYLPDIKGLPYEMYSIKTENLSWETLKRHRQEFEVSTYRLIYFFMEDESRKAETVAQIQERIVDTLYHFPKQR